MTDRGTLPRTFGPYVLTRSLGSDPLGSTFRAGTAAGATLKPFLLVRVFDGKSVDRAALLPAMETAVEHLDEFRGQAAARGAVLGVVDDVPFAGIDYVPGASVERVLAAGAGEPVLSPENSLLIGEKLAAALEAGRAFSKTTGAPHGFLVPAFVTISTDGETRVFGAGLGPGLLPSLAHPEAKTAFGPWIAPEVLSSGRASAAGDVYSLAAIVVASATGRVPEPGRAADLLSAAPFLPEPANLLARLLHADPSRREGGDPPVVRLALARILAGAGSRASTFQLAFSMSRKFTTAFDEEALQMADEGAIDPLALTKAEERAASRRASPPPTPPVPTFGVDVPAASGEMRKKGLPVPAIVTTVAAIAVLAGGAALFLKTGRPGKAVPAPAPTAAALPTAAPVPTPVMVGKEDPAFQEALQRKMREEAAKIQDQISREQKTVGQRRETSLARAADEARSAREAEDAARAARARDDTEEATRLARAAAEARLREEMARRAAAAAEETPREAKSGDLVDATRVDKVPAAVRVVKPEVTLIARQRRVFGAVMARVLVNETGRVEAVEILRDTNPSVGLAKTTRDALLKWEWKPATKGGRPVKTWTVVPVPFDLR